MVKRISRRYAGQGIREVDAWTRDEVATLLATAKAHEPYVYPVLLAAHSCCERRGRIKGPKSDKPRNVPLSPEIKNLLEELRGSRRSREGL